MAEANRQSRPDVLFIDANGGQGGPSYSMLHLISGLEALGESTSTMLPEGHMASEMRKQGRDVVAWRAKGRHRRIRAMWHASIAVCRAPVGTRVHCNTPSAFNLVFPALLLRRKLVVVIHGRDYRITPRRARALRAALRVRPAIVVPVTQEAARLYARAIGSARVSAHVPNPIAAFPEREERRRSGREGSFIVGWAGGQGPKYGLDLLVETLGASSGWQARVFGISDSFPPTHLRQAAESRAVELGVRHRLVYMGRVPDIRGPLTACDIFICTSRHESFGRAPLEAMSAGLPVVAPRLPALLESIGSENALWYAPGDARGAAALIERLQSDVELRQSMSRRGLDRTHEYEPTTVAKALHQRLAAARGEFGRQGIGKRSQRQLNPDRVLP